MEEYKKMEKKRKRFAVRLKTSKGIECTEIAGPVSNSRFIRFFINLRIILQALAIHYYREFIENHIKKLFIQE